MEDTFEKFPHINNLYKAQDILLEPEVIVLEKIDGSNARLGMKDNKFLAGTRNRVIARIEKEQPLLDAESDFGFISFLRTNNLPTKFFNAFAGMDIVFYGEQFGSGIQKRINYGPNKYFRVFSVRVNGDFVSWDAVKDYCAQVGLDTVPELYRGKPIPSELEKFLSLESKTAQLNGVSDPSNKHEGMVIYPIPMKRDSHDEWLIAKFKSPEFEEQASRTRMTSHMAIPIPDTVTAFVAEFVTPMRLEHVLDQLREQGVDVTDVRATGSVLKNMNQDVQREGKAEWEALGIEWKKISKLVGEKTAILFRQHLVSQISVQ